MFDFCKKCPHPNQGCFSCPHLQKRVEEDVSRDFKKQRLLEKVKDILPVNIHKPGSFFISHEISKEDIVLEGDTLVFNVYAVGMVPSLRRAWLNFAKKARRRGVNVWVNFRR